MDVLPKFYKYKNGRLPKTTVDDEIDYKEPEKIELTLLSAKEISYYKSNLLKINGNFCELTDLAKLTTDSELDKTIFWTNTYAHIFHDMFCVDNVGNTHMENPQHNTAIIRPVLRVTSGFLERQDQLKTIVVKKQFEDFYYKIIKFGEYPQEIAPKKIQFMLNLACNNSLFKNKIKRTLNIYTLTTKKYLYRSSFYSYNKSYNSHDYYVFKFDNKKYICIQNKEGKNIWVQILPIEWYLDEKNNKLISLKGLLSGIPFFSDENSDVFTYNGNYKESWMYKYLNDCMLPDMLQYEHIDYELLKDDENKITLNKMESKIHCSNDIVLINEIEYNLSKLKEVSPNLYLKYSEEYQNILKNNISDIGTLASFNGRIIAELTIIKEKPTDLINYLKNIKEEYLNNFLNHNKNSTKLDLKKLDKIYELFLLKQKNYSMIDKIEVLKNISLIYFLEVYDNKNCITIKDLENTYFEEQIQNIIVWINEFIKQDIITCSYFLSLSDDINTKVMLDMIKNIEFKSNKVKKR